MRIRLVMLGKTRRSELRALLEDYLARIRHYADIAAVELRDSATALRKLQPDPTSSVILLDAAGKQFTSEQFACWLAERRDAGTRELLFLCGGAEGFSAALRRRATLRISRVALAEQLYRSFATLAGHPYPK